MSRRIYYGNGGGAAQLKISINRNRLAVKLGVKLAWRMAAKSWRKTKRSVWPKTMIWRKPGK